MNLRAAFLADAALQNADGTFMVWRGGITDILVTGLPAGVRFALVLRLEADPMEASQLHEMSIAVHYQGNPLGPQQTTPLALKEAPGEPRLYLNVVANLQFGIPEPGEGYIEVVFDREIVVPRVYFRVRPMATGPFAPGTL